MSYEELIRNWEGEDESVGLEDTVFLSHEQMAYIIGQDQLLDDVLAHQEGQM